MDVYFILEVSVRQSMALLVVPSICLPRTVRRGLARVNSSVEFIGMIVPEEGYVIVTVGYAIYAILKASVLELPRELVACICSSSVVPDVVSCSLPTILPVDEMNASPDGSSPVRL